MAVHVYTLTQIGKTNVVGNRKQKSYKLTADTGTYSTGGDAFTASQFGLKKFDFALASTVTGGASGATINWLGITFNAAMTSFTLQVYESAATGLPGLEKTNNEAEVASFEARLFVQGY